MGCDGKHGSRALYYSGVNIPLEVASCHYC